MSKKKGKKKPSSKIDTALKVVQILGGITTIIKATLDIIKMIIEMLKG